MENKLYFIRRLIYSLKRDYGFTLEIHRLNSSIVDRDTGRKTTEIVALKIKRAILLPKNKIRDFAYDLSFIAANRNFTYGGFFDKNSRTILIDNRDLKFKILPGDYATIDHARYNVKKVEDFDNDLATILNVEAIQGELPSAIIEAKTENTLELGGGNVGEL